MESIHTTIILSLRIAIWFVVLWKLGNVDNAPGNKRVNWFIKGRYNLCVLKLTHFAFLKSIKLLEWIFHSHATVLIHYLSLSKVIYAYRASVLCRLTWTLSRTTIRFGAKWSFDKILNHFDNSIVRFETWNGSWWRRSTCLLWSTNFQVISHWITVLMLLHHILISLITDRIIFLLILTCHCSPFVFYVVMLCNEVAPEFAIIALFLILLI